MAVGPRWVHFFVAIMAFLLRPLAAASPLTTDLEHMMASCSSAQSTGSQPAAAGHSTCQATQVSTLNSSHTNLECPAAALATLLQSSAHSAAKDALGLSACQVWPLLEDRALWIVGGQQAKELWTSLHCLLANYSVVSHAPVVLDELSEHLFQQTRAEGNPTMCQELVNNTRMCLLHLPLPEQVVSAGLPWLRNYHLSPNDIVVTGFELPSSSSSSRKHLQEYANQVFIFSKAFPNMLWRQQSLADASEELRILENGRALVIPHQPWWPGDSQASKHSHGKACSSLLWVHAVARSLRAHVGSAGTARL